MAYLFGFTEGLCEIQSHQIVPETRGLDGFQGLFGGAGGLLKNQISHCYIIYLNFLFLLVPPYMPRAHVAD